MITVRIKGGLGNQLFQYAAAYALAKRLNQDVRLDISFYPNQTLRGYKLEYLNIEKSEIANKFPLSISFLKNRYINKGLRMLHVSTIGKHPLYLLETLSDIVPQYYSVNSNDIYIDGYYQSEKYFKEYKNELIKQFSQNYNPEKEYLECLDEIKRTTSIAVHLRRGDFLKAQYNNNPNHYLLGEEYYQNSREFVEKKVDNPTFFWFSDDIEWVQHHFDRRDNFRFVTMRTKHPDIDELMLMKNCKHIIAANSTFSWWASWLNENTDAMHICPSKRYGNANMIPDNWIKISVE